MLALVATLLLACGAKAHADPPILTSVTGTCDPGVGTSSFTTTPVSGVHDLLDWRVKVDGGPGSWEGVTSWNGASTFWGTDQSLPNGSAASGTVHCDSAPSPLHYEIDWYEPPVPPATFTGNLAPGQLSTLGVGVPELGGYVLSSPTSSVLSVFDGSDFTPLPGDGLEVIADSGPSDFEIRSDDAAQAPFSFQVGGEEVPEVFGDGQIPVSTAASPAPVLLGFTLNVPAHVTADLLALSDNETPVRRLLDTFEDGDFSFTWDLKDASGTFVDEGRYLIRVTATNSAGSVTNYGDVVRDIRGPSITIHPSVNQHVPLRVDIFDVSLVRSAVVTIDGQGTSFSTGAVRFQKYLPLGAHTVSVSATDRLGHTSSAAQSFTVQDPKPLKFFQCDAVQAKILVRHTPTLVARLRKLGRLGKRDDVFRGFSLAKTACVHIASPAVEGMAILLKARHGNTTPFVFAIGAVPPPNVWHVAQASTKVRIRSIAGRGRDLVERRVLPSGKTRLITLSWGLGHLVQVHK
jgi:hypothetical protein